MNLVLLEGISRLPRALLSFPGRQWRQAELADVHRTEPRIALAAAEAGEHGGLGCGQSRGLERDGCGRLAGRLEGGRHMAEARDGTPVLGPGGRSHEAGKTRAGARNRRGGVHAVVRGGAAVSRTRTCRSCRRTWRRRRQRVLAEKLGVREVSSGGKLWLITPKDVGVFQAIRRVDGIPIVCDVQIYLDLLQVGLRGPDQAEALRAWEGFRKP